MPFILAQQVSGEFLIDPIKPAVLFLTALVGCAIVSKLVSDVHKCGLPSHKWHSILISGLVAGLAAGILIPTFWISWPAQILVTAGPLMLYWKHRNASVPEKQKFVIGGETVRSFFKKRGATKSLAGAQLSFKDANKKDRPSPSKNDPALAAFQAADTLLGAALKRRASRVDLVVKQDASNAAVTVDGVRSKIESPTPEITVAMIDYLKGIADLDVKEKRKRQSGSFFAVLDENLIPVSISIAGSSAGQQLRIDFDRAKALSRTIAQVGFLPNQEKVLQPLVDPMDRGGIVLIGAAPGQGLTSTSLALLAGHDAFTAAVKTLEKNLIHRLDGVDHQTWTSAQGGVDYSTQLQSIIRRGPDVVYVEDLSEVGVGKLIAAPANSEIRFYVSMPVDGVAAMITEWVKAVGDVKAAAAALRMVISQKLCRKLCVACRVGYQPSPDQAKKLGIGAGKNVELFKASGKVQMKNKVMDCPMCTGTGYSGQVGICEVFVVDDEARSFLTKGDLKSAYNSSRLRNKLPGMQETALLRVRDGTTSLEEAIRILSPAAKAPASPSPSMNKPAGAPAAPAGGAKPTPSANKPTNKPKASP